MLSTSRTGMPSRFIVPGTTRENGRDYHVTIRYQSGVEASTIVGAPDIQQAISYASNLWVNTEVIAAAEAG